MGTDEAATRVVDEPMNPEATESSIGWLELFFDLVVVAAIAVLTQGLEEAPSLAGVGMFLVLYGAIWLTWTSVVLYANVAQKAARTRPIVLAMFLIAMMAATARTTSSSGPTPSPPGFSSHG